MIIVGSLRRVALAGALAGLSSAAMLSPSSAQPVRPNGYPVTNVNLRGGPGTYYPALLVVPARAPISILGCLGDYSWCDVLFQGNRGWMRSIYLQGWYRGQYYSLGDYAPRLGYRVVSFDIGPYWDSNYRDRPFYRDRGKWGGAGGSYGEGWTDRGSFYGRLAPYGSWIWLQGQYVWVPDNVGPYWRPYTVGRWAFTERYGWMWVSREPFGWATYHYGRWGFSNRVGWFWVPGSRWAPAWVSWRQSDDYLAWAPIPPSPDEGFGVNIRVGTVPDYYWQVVPNREFLSDDLPRNIVRDRKRFDPILRDTRPLGNTTVTNNNVVVNNVVNLTYVEEKTKKKVVIHKVERTKDEARAKGGKVQGEAIEIFQPPADQAAAAVAPPAPKPIEEVAAESKTKDQAEGAATTEELLVPPEVQKTPEAEAKQSAPPPPPPAPAADGAPPAEEEAAAPPPPGPPAEEAAPPPQEEAAPPPSAAEEAPPPAKQTLPPVKEAAPPPPADEVPPPAVDEAAPPPPAGEVLPPPAAEEAAPPPPPASPAEEAPPKVKKEIKPKFKKDQGETAAPDESLPPAPPPPPLEDAVPPPPQDMVPPPPPSSGAEAQKMKREGKPKFEKNQGETAVPEAGPPPPPPPSEDAGAPPQDGYGPPKAKKAGKPNGGNGNGKGKDQPPAEPCPEGMVALEDGSCVPTQ